MYQTQTYRVVACFSLEHEYLSCVVERKVQNLQQYSRIFCFDFTGTIEIGSVISLRIICCSDEDTFTSYNSRIAHIVCLVF